MRPDASNWRVITDYLGEGAQAGSVEESEMVNKERETL
jgi:hypothetical protein